MRVKIVKVEFLTGLREVFKRYGPPSEVQFPSLSGQPSKVLKEPDEI